MSEYNLDTVDPHDADECRAGMKRLRDERDSARQWAMTFEGAERVTKNLLAAEQMRSARYAALLDAHGIDRSREDDVTGANSGDYVVNLLWVQGNY